MMRFYAVEHPLQLTWRRFRVLMAGLPGESAFVRSINAEIEDLASATPSAVAREFDRRAGRTGGPRTTVTWDQYAKGGR